MPITILDNARGFETGVGSANNMYNSIVTGKQQAQEFAEWINNNRWYAILEDSGLRWRDGGSQAFTTSELYAKFEAEMNQQNNGG